MLSLHSLGISHGGDKGTATPLIGVLTRSSDSSSAKAAKVMAMSVARKRCRANCFEPVHPLGAVLVTCAVGPILYPP